MLPDSENPKFVTKTRRITLKSLLTVRRSVRRLMLGMIVVGIGFAVALVLAEGIIRLFRLAPTEGLATVTESDFHRVPGLFTPGQSFLNQQLPALPHHISINDLGYRGKHFPLKKPSHELRVLMIGDSFTFGDFVDDNETLPAQLEVELRKWCKNARVINAGVGGTTLITHAAMVERSHKLEIDVVVLTFSVNDVDDLAYPMWVSLAENRRLKSRFPLSLLYPIIRDTGLWNFALYVRAHVVSRWQQSTDTSGKPTMSKSDLNVQTRDELREYYSEVLDRLHNDLKQQGIPLIFNIYPSHHNLTGRGSTELLEWAVRTGTSASIPTINLLFPLRYSGLTTDSIYLLPHDGHPMALGYRVSTVFFSEQLRQVKSMMMLCCETRCSS